MIHFYNKNIDTIFLTVCLRYRLWTDRDETGAKRCAIISNRFTTKEFARFCSFKGNKFGKGGDTAFLRGFLGEFMVVSVSLLAVGDILVSSLRRGRQAA